MSASSIWAKSHSTDLSTSSLFIELHCRRSVIIKETNYLL